MLIFADFARIADFNGDGHIGTKEGSRPVVGSRPLSRSCSCTSATGSERKRTPSPGEGPLVGRYLLVNYTKQVV